jgi:RNAse (barnase) inhibitor barstar
VRAEDARLLERSSAEGIHFAEPDVLPAIRGLAALHVFEIRRPFSSEGELFAAIAAAMDFQDEFGENWDALHDALRDLQRDPGQRGFVLVVHNAEALWREVPRVIGQLIESWQLVGTWWHDDGVPFHLVFVW